MRATLYTPFLPPQELPTTGLRLPDPTTGFASVPDEVVAFLGCARALVDIQACGPNYVVYTIFDFSGEVNRSAMSAVTEITGEIFDLNDEDSLLCGPVMIVKS